MKTPGIPNAERSARVFGCTVEQAKALMARNAAGLQKMAERAAKTGRKYRGYTETELRESASDYLEASR